MLLFIDNAFLDDKHIYLKQIRIVIQILLMFFPHGHIGNG